MRCGGEVLALLAVFEPTRSRNGRYVLATWLVPTPAQDQAYVGFSW